MNKVALIAVFLTACFSLVASKSFAENFIYDDENIQLQNIVVRSTGIEFTVLKKKGKKKINITPNSSCINTFYVSPLTAEYNTIAAFLLTAKASKKKIGIEYDTDIADCMVPVVSVGIP